MEFFRPFTFLIILIESLRLLPRNGKLISFVALFSLALHVCLSFFFSHSLNLHSFLLLSPYSTLSVQQPFPAAAAAPAAADLALALVNVTNVPAASSTQLRHKFVALLGIEFAFLLGFSAVSAVATVATVVVSSVSYKTRTLSLRSFLSSVWRSIPRFIVTGFYSFLVTVGYLAFALTLATPLLVYLNFTTVSIIATGIAAFLVYLYLLVPLALSLVVAIVEENCCGLEALGKAADLIRGERIHGFLLNVTFNATVLVVLYVVQTTSSSGYRAALKAAAAAGVVFLVKLVGDVAYTVLYFHCKKDRGEEIELFGSLQYGRLPTTRVIVMGEDEEDMPLNMPK